MIRRPPPPYRGVELVHGCHRLAPLPDQSCSSTLDWSQHDAGAFATTLELKGSMVKRLSGFELDDELYQLRHG